MKTSDGSVRLTIRDGGWAILLAIAIVVALLAWALAGVVAGHRPIGGGDLASYGFDLSTAIVPLEDLTPSGQPRDFLRPLEVAATMPGRAMVDFNASVRKRYVVSGDRVIGVILNGEARAYPLAVIEAHEIISDTLAGVPIAVTYSPFADAAVVYDRRVGEQTLALHVSGILRDANTIYYDARLPRDTTPPSLWQQLDGRAIAGPAAVRGERLQSVGQVSVTTWADWLAAHPDTTVIARDEGLVRLYQSISYDREHARPELDFPVTPLPPEHSLAAKDRVLVFRRNASRTAVPLAAVAAAPDRTLEVDVGGTTVRLVAGAVPGTCRIEGPEDLRSISCFWFAAHASLGVEVNELFDRHGAEFTVP